MTTTNSPVLVTGATGFIGRALVPALKARGYLVRAATRRLGRAYFDPGVDWVECDLLQPETLPGALDGVRSAYYLVHSMGGGGMEPFREREARSAQAFAAAAARAGLERIVYLGGVAPRHEGSVHLRSRLDVGEILRRGAVPALELRASMVVGKGSVSWQIVRDLSFRLPVMILPAWLKSRTRPLALGDAVSALLDGLDVPLESSAWFDLPGPDTLTGRDILERIAALRGRRIPMLSVPLLTPYLSALWLRLVTRADFALARELVVGLSDDLLPRDEEYWRLTRHPPRIPFDEAARRALAEEEARQESSGVLGDLAEALVYRVTPRLSG